MDKLNGSALTDEQLDDILREHWSYQGVPSEEDIRSAMRAAIAAHVADLDQPSANADALMALDAALIKAGRKAAPKPVRHFRSCGEDL
ncbi:hypothetical protein [Burkholderia anthina]|uniref:hypothetical protein n=1 Tax=Burkholderia anthina TaxID=179879 RepID=UPI00158BF5AA|nr:hypothetical protein [Burkholderia anthina]